MRIFAISDLHLDATHSKPMNIFGMIWEGHEKQILESYKSFKIRKTDVLVIPGDLSWAMKLEDAKKDFEFLKNFKCKIIILKGNHDYWWSSLTSVREALPENVFAMQNDAIKIGNYVFCGTRGWNIKEAGKKYEEEDQKIFDREVIRLGLSIDSAKKLVASKKNKIVCLTHFPPFNSKKETNPFLEKILDAQIEIVIFGHLHGGKHNCKAITQIGKTKFYLTSCDFLKNNIIQIF